MPELEDNEHKCNKMDSIKFSIDEDYDGWYLFKIDDNNFADPISIIEYCPFCGVKLDA
jgi:hypothetical protein